MKNLILDALEYTALRLPDKVAFADPDTSVRFCELVRLSRAVGSALLPLAAPRSVIAFYLDKSVQAIVGFMGAVYAGCAYAPLNLRYPAARIRAILDTLRAPVVVTDAQNREALLACGYDGAVLDIDALMLTPIDEDGLARVRTQMIDIDPLYVNFTSGSTGTPKGVVVCHRNVMDFIPCFTEIFSITDRDVLANQAPFDFDVSVKDIYSGIFSGASVQIIPTPYFSKPTVLMDFLCERQVTVLVWAVSALCFLTTMNALEYRKPEGVRAILFSGEVMPVKHLHKLQKHLPDAMYVNLYGPTEITCNCTYYIVDRDFQEGDTLPIGIPFPNERILLLGEDGRAVTAPGEMGELCVSGTAVALGYFRDAERTAKAFVQNPLNPCTLETIYRTGDLVKLNDRGEMVYVSRKDFQVKHMGHRIELGEIEAQLCAVPGVERALVGYLHEKGKILCFHTGAAEKQAIAAALREVLPAYMIPNLFMHVETMPLNKNGKIDRAALMASYEQRRKEPRRG